MADNETEYSGMSTTMDSDLHLNKTIGIPMHRKIAYIATSCTQIVIVLYTILSLLYYEYSRSQKTFGKRIFNRRSRSGKQTSSYTHSSDASSAPNKESSTKSKSPKRGSRTLRILCIASATLTLIRILMEFAELIPSVENHITCSLFYVPLVISYSIALATIYFILWFRLFIFLSHPAMRHLGSKVTRILAYVVLFLIFSASLNYAIWYLATTESVLDYGGCKLSVTDNVTDKIRFVMITVLAVVSQMSLLGLFLYPLLKHRAAMQKLYEKSQSENALSPDLKGKQNLSNKFKRNKKGISKLSQSFTSSISRKKNRQIKRQAAIVVVIKRVMLTAIACIISDIVTGGMATALRSQPRVVTNLMFDSNLIVNLICVIISFKDWRARLTFNRYNPNSSDLHDSKLNKSLSLKTDNNNGDSVFTNGAMSPKVFSQVTNSTPILSPSNEVDDPNKSRFIFEDKSRSTSNTGMET